MNPPGFFLAQADFQACFPTRNSFVPRCYGKAAIACQPNGAHTSYR